MYAITLRLSFISFGYLVLKWIERVDIYIYARGGSTMPSGSETPSPAINLFVFGSTHKINIIIERGSLPNSIHDQNKWLLHVHCSFIQRSWVLATLVCCGCGQIDCVICFNSKQSNNSHWIDFYFSVFCFRHRTNCSITSVRCLSHLVKENIWGNIRELVLSHFTLNDFQLMGRRLVLTSSEVAHEMKSSFCRTRCTCYLCFLRKRSNTKPWVWHGRWNVFGFGIWNCKRDIDAEECQNGKLARNCAQLLSYVYCFQLNSILCGCVFFTSSLSLSLSGSGVSALGCHKTKRVNFGFEFTQCARHQWKSYQFSGKGIESLVRSLKFAYGIHSSQFRWPSAPPKNASTLNIPLDGIPSSSLYCAYLRQRANVGHHDVIHVFMNCVKL